MPLFKLATRLLRCFLSLPPSQAPPFLQNNSLSATHFIVERRVDQDILLFLRRRRRYKNLRRWLEEVSWREMEGNEENLRDSISRTNRNRKKLERYKRRIDAQ